MNPFEAKWTVKLLLVAGLLPLSGMAANAAPISPAAQRVADTIDALDVEHHWPAGVHVNWRTGDSDGREERSSGKHTHCSAFVAAAAKRFGIYILRPPEHPQILLANAQYDWLAAEGASQGWRELAGPVAAQDAANEGQFVVATYHNRNDDKPGHIAIVRPSDKATSAVRLEGPQITQAGVSNYRSTSLEVGFRGHPGAWGRGEIKYYAHAVPARARSRHRARMKPENGRVGGLRAARARWPGNGQRLCVEAYRRPNFPGKPRVS